MRAHPGVVLGFVSILRGPEPNNAVSTELPRQPAADITYEVVDGKRHAFLEDAGDFSSPIWLTDPAMALIKRALKEEERLAKQYQETKQYVAQLSGARESLYLLDWLGTVARFAAATSCALAKAATPEAQRALYGALFELTLEQEQALRQLETQRRKLTE